MSTRRRNQEVQQRFYRFRLRSLQAVLKGIVRWLLRVLLQIGRGPRWLQAGFVLPTTVMLLLIVTLTVGSISLRTFNRTNQVIGDRQQRTIYNAATPAIDRAKAKIEFLMDATRDDRLPSGIPGEKQLLGMMLNDERDLDPDAAREFIVTQKLITASDGVTQVDPYTFPDEVDTAQLLGLPNSLDVDGDGRPDRLDLDGDTLPDNAWSYLADTDGDGNNDSLVVYSILFETPEDLDTLRDSREAAVTDRANNLQVRHGPLSIIQPENPLCNNRTDAPPIETGWFGDFAAVRKNFQVNAVVIPLATNDDGTPRLDGGQLVPNPTNTIATLEFQQDRQFDQGNKWGAWFRNDLEIYPGPIFNWNGAMHTEGNLIVGQNDRFRAFLISSPNSCLYERQSSEVTIARVEANPDEGIPAFEGQIISGRVNVNDTSAASKFHIHDVPDPITGDEADLEIPNDSIVDGREPSEFILDPVKLFTQDISVPRDEGLDLDAARDPDWVDRLLSNEQTGRIYNKREDTPRIDDFYRADNRYGPKPRYDGREIPVDIGTPITGGEMVASGLTDAQLTSNLAVDSNLGLDGYWERRARREGMRVLVGQRLELGNSFGWQGDADALYPWEPITDPTTCMPSGRCHEAKQRRLLRDNLAAVQSLAVYHSNLADDDGDFPLLCMAVTAHPGTHETLKASTAFNTLSTAIGTLPASVTTDIDISFFDGRGTNGWEYGPPAADAAAFGAALGGELGTALTNLATFAGDPIGGAPSFTPVQDAEVHPQPFFNMWGDFSMLRRILDSGTAYADLSVADKTYLHTAACTVGMLANNVQTLTDYDYTDVINSTLLTNLGAAIAALSDSNPTNGEITAAGTTDAWTITRRDGTAYTALVPGSGTAVADLPAEAFIAALYDTDDPALTDNLQRLARFAHLKEQVARDREFGFAAGGTCGLTGSLNVLCPDGPKFPSLFYLFPLVDHAHDGTGGTAQPTTEPYIDDTGYVATQNTGLQYRVINSVTPEDLSAIALTPAAEADWQFPSDTTASAADRPNLITIDGAETAIALLDKGIYDGREAMNVRVLDLDLDLLRRNLVAAGGDTWIPKRGIVYAFREDSKREDMIVRPLETGTTWDACDTDAEIQVAACLMDAVTDVLHDPPLNDANSISPKAVDYYADPDRQANGFRLRNGMELGRENDEGRGLSFISDNSVYIQGDFNLHQTVGCGGDPACLLEEFEEKLPTGAAYNNADFYGRVTLDASFARRGPDAFGLGPDLWRPTEILADAVMIVSDNFCDGSVADGFLTAGFDTFVGGLNSVEVLSTTAGYDASDVYHLCDGSGDRTSYLNQNRPTDEPDDDEGWKLENPFDPGSPIEISRNGEFSDSGVDPATGTIGTIDLYADNFYDFADSKPLIVPAETRVNAVIISGLVPSREFQSYGGLHNFPRFLEYWNNIRLYISGAFLQLNFSNAATAPYDQEFWEPVATPVLTDSVRNNYYQAPTRLWGYDVGLQYAPAGPIAQRFTDAGSFRSEFYDEPAADDEYIVNLREAVLPYLGG